MRNHFIHVSCVKAPRRWSGRSWEGPGADPRRKDSAALATSAASKSGTAARRGGSRRSRCGSEAKGCLARSSCRISAEVANGGACVRALQALESSPSAASRQHRAWRASCPPLPREGLGRAVSRSDQSSKRSPSSHRLHRRRTACASCALCLTPLRLGAASKDLGSVSNSCQAASVLWAATLASARARHWAQEARAACGTWRRVATGATMMSAKVGSPEWSWEPKGRCATARACGRHWGWAPWRRLATSRPRTLHWSRLWAVRYAPGTAPDNAPEAWSLRALRPMGGVTAPCRSTSDAPAWDVGRQGVGSPKRGGTLSPWQKGEGETAATKGY